MASASLPNEQTNNCYYSILVLRAHDFGISISHFPSIRRRPISGLLPRAGKERTGYTMLGTEKSTRCLLPITTGNSNY